jgi:hypothetical protein
MSLSSHLESKRSPVRAWFEKQLPETRDVAREANRSLRRGAAECPVPRIDGADASLVGTGIDYLLRACLRVSSIEWTVASKAVQALAANPRIGMRAIEVEREAVRDIKQLRPSRRDLADHQWADLSIRCLVLARFEQFYRAGPMNPAILDFVVRPLRECDSLDQFIELSLSSSTIQDLTQLGRAAWEDHCDLRRARPLVLNPTFFQSSALGGADADLIVRRRLIDWKATATIGVVSRHELWQLIGYAMADTKDHFAIREVSIAALRWRSTVSWPLKDLLDELAPGSQAEPRTVGGSTPRRKLVDLPGLREDFAHAVATARTERRLNRRLGRPKGTLPSPPKS